MKKNSFLTAVALLALLASLQPALAQRAPRDGAKQPQAPGGNPAPANNNNSTEIDSSTSTALDYLFNHKAGDGTTAKAGQDVASALADRIKAIDMLNTPAGLDDPQVRARFETYVSLKEVPEARINEYFGKMTQVSETLKTGDIFGAWKMLYALGDYSDLDAGISRELAHHIEIFWNTAHTKSSLEMANTKLRGDIEASSHNIDVMSTESALSQSNQSLKNGGKNGGGNNNNNNNNNANNQNTTNSPLNNPNADPTAAEAAIMPSIGNFGGKARMTDEYLNLLEAHARIKMNEIRANKMDDQDRMDFSDYIRTLYNGHRYYHVILAADFYRTIFNEGDYPQDIVNQATASAGTTGRTGVDAASQVAKGMGINARGPINALNKFGNLAGGDTLGGTNTQPLSIADEVTSALEINNRVSQSIEVFKYKAAKSEIAAASVELEEAFIGNEFHPGLQGLVREDKEKVGTYLSKLDVLKNQLEVRDFEQVEGQIADIKKIAVDFDSTKPMALVNGIKLESQLRLGQAQLLAQGDHLAEAMEEFKTAGEEWPGNPDLAKLAGVFFKTNTGLNQSTADFDRMVQDQNDRGIFEKKLEFALAVKGDTVREQQLRDAITKISKAEEASAKANMLAMNGDVNGAWETIEIAAQDLPDDLKLNKLLANLSGRSADFVSAINKARDAESKKELGYSLTWYVNAQSYYPASTIANEGIKRVSNELLAPGGSSSDVNPSATPAPAPASPSTSSTEKSSPAVSSSAPASSADTN